MSDLQNLVKTFSKLKDHSVQEPEVLDNGEIDLQVLIPNKNQTIEEVYTFNTRGTLIKRRIFRNLGDLGESETIL